jgi:hypothetical protein
MAICPTINLHSDRTHSDNNLLQKNLVKVGLNTISESSQGLISHDYHNPAHSETLDNQQSKERWIHNGKLPFVERLFLKYNQLELDIGVTR